MAYARPPAPPGLRILEDFCNTAERLQGRDALCDAAAARAWISAAGLGGAERLGEADAQHLREVREALRDRLADPGDGAACERLTATARTHLGPPRWRAGDGEPRLREGGEPNGPGAVAAPALEALARAEIAGSAVRLKVCAAPECRWVFYDRSPANSGSWCSMEICGARHKMRSYRTRRRGQASAR